MNINLFNLSLLLVKSNSTILITSKQFKKQFSSGFKNYALFLQVFGVDDPFLSPLQWTAYVKWIGYLNKWLT